MAGEAGSLKGTQPKFEGSERTHRGQGLPGSKMAQINKNTVQDTRSLALEGLSVHPLWTHLMGEWNQPQAQMDPGTMPDEETDVTRSDLDFDTIEAAVMETARGRWFLKEYARRNRNADTQAVLEALERLKDRPLDVSTVVPLKAYLEEMAATIRRTMEEVRSFPVIETADLSEAELQQAAEQRIRQMIRTLLYLEGQIQQMIDVNKVEIERTDVSLEASPFEGETARDLPARPAFLM
jgi:hypothetical protein